MSDADAFDGVWSLLSHGVAHCCLVDKITLCPTVYDNLARFVARIAPTDKECSSVMRTVGGIYGFCNGEYTNDPMDITYKYRDKTGIFDGVLFVKGCEVVRGGDGMFSQVGRAENDQAD